MATMTYRTTFALDETTAQRLKRLSSKWQVSQAEVVRRSLEQAEKAGSHVQQDPVALLQKLHEQDAGLLKDEAASYMARIRKDRKNWRG